MHANIAEMEIINDVDMDKGEDAGRSAAVAAGDKKGDDDGGYKAATSMSDPSRPPSGHEYLDHTADVQLHSWGPTIKEAYEQSALAMFGYMTDLDTVEECSTHRVEASGRDLQTALYSFLDEWLFAFAAEPNFVPFKIDILEFRRREAGDNDEEDGEVFIASMGYGETFTLGKHPQGTEVKAITYSAMQVIEENEYAEVFVIVDI